MLLVLDVGNTNTVMGIYREDQLLGNWRVTTEARRTTDELAVLYHSLIRMQGIEPASISDVIISCVVPPLLPFLVEMFEECFSITPLVVAPGIRTGIAIKVENPREVGADRIVNAVAAYHHYPGQCIVIDFGTATTFDIISHHAEYLGGLICPGIAISAEALFRRASKLPHIEIIKPAGIIGKNTVHSIQSGIYFGYCEMVNGIIRQLRQTIEKVPTKVIATGGYASLVAEGSQGIDEVRPTLTLEGLKLIFDRNRPSE